MALDRVVEVERTEVEFGPVSAEQLFELLVLERGREGQPGVLLRMGMV